jgi:hypothetical protein
MLTTLAPEIEKKNTAIYPGCTLYISTTLILTKDNSRIVPASHLFGENLTNGDTAQIFWRKSPFSLKPICQIAPLLKERVVTSMPTDYTFNAPEENITS